MPFLKAIAYEPSSVFDSIYSSPSFLVLLVLIYLVLPTYFEGTRQSRGRPGDDGPAASHALGLGIFGRSGAGARWNESEEWQ